MYVTRYAWEMGGALYPWLQQHQATDCQQEQLLLHRTRVINSFAASAAHLQPPPPKKGERKKEEEEKTIETLAHK